MYEALEGIVPAILAGVIPEIHPETLLRRFLKEVCLELLQRFLQFS